MSSSNAEKTVAFFEAFKGILAFLVASGSLALINRDVHDFAVRIVEHLHLNPAAKYPSIFVNAASHIQNSQLFLLAFGSFLYSVVRIFEAYGLYSGKTWAELLAAGSGAIYVPAEILKIHHHPSWLAYCFLIVNLAVVVIMIRALMQKRSIHRNNSRPNIV